MTIVRVRARRIIGVIPSVVVMNAAASFVGILKIKNVALEKSGVKPLCDNVASVKSPC